MIVNAADNLIDFIRPQVKILVLTFFTYLALC